MDLEDDVDDDKTLFTLLKRQVSNFFMRLIWYTKLADFVSYRNVLAIFDDTSKQVRWRKVDFGFVQKNCPLCNVFLENMI